MDRLELEEGDLDDLDEDEVRDELEQIHQKRLLAEDKRDVRLFQEAFLEDGELHSDKARERRFKWQGIGEIKSWIEVNLDFLINDFVN